MGQSSSFVTPTSIQQKHVPFETSVMRTTPNQDDLISILGRLRDNEMLPVYIATTHNRYIAPPKGWAYDQPDTEFAIPGRAWQFVKKNGGKLYLSEWGDQFDRKSNPYVRFFLSLDPVTNMVRGYNVGTQDDLTIQYASDMMQSGTGMGGVTIYDNLRKVYWAYTPYQHGQEYPITASATPYVWHITPTQVELGGIMTLGARDFFTPKYLPTHFQ